MKDTTVPQDPKELPAPSKKHKLSLSLARRDCFQMLTSTDVEDVCKGYTLENTFKKPMINLLNQCLLVFFMEAYKEDGGRHAASILLTNCYGKLHVLSLHCVRIRIS